MSFTGRMISGGVKPVLLVHRLQRCCSLGRLPWRPEIDSGLSSCCQNRKQKEKTEEVNRRCPGGWCNESHVDWWTSCRRGMELGFDEKQAGGHANSSCLSFLLANAWLYHQSQNSDLYDASIESRLTLRKNIAQEDRTEKLLIPANYWKKRTGWEHDPLILCNCRVFPTVDFL